MKTGSESIEMNIRMRWILLFAKFIARVDDPRLSKCVMFRGLVGGADGVEGEELEWMECYRNADQWATGAHDGEEWRKMAGQGTYFSWRNGSPHRKSGLDYDMQ